MPRDNSEEIERKAALRHDHRASANPYHVRHELERRKLAAEELIKKRNEMLAVLTAKREQEAQQRGPNQNFRGR
jgi:hypothetical protein